MSHIHVIRPSVPGCVPPRRRRRPLAAVLGLALLAGGCASPGPAAPAPAPVEPAVPRTAVARAGFDTYAYPGDSALRVWRQASPYEWIGFYLPAPCHRETSWSGRREAITSLGWEIAVLYVGQQTWEGVQAAQPADTARPPARDSAAAVQDSTVTPPPACAPSQLTAERGATDGADAVARTAAEGFAPGTVVYLDVERMETVPESMRDYVRAWVGQLAADGRYRPGLYAHLRNAAELHALVREALGTDGTDGAAGVPLWIASRTAADGTPFDLWTRTPTEVGLAGATIWQGAFDVRETWGGVTLRIDQNVRGREP